MLVIGGAMLVAAGTGILAAISVKTAAAAVIGLVTVLAAIFRPVVVVLILFLTVYPSTLTLAGISIQRLGGPLALLVAVAQLLRERHPRCPRLAGDLARVHGGGAPRAQGFQGSAPDLLGRRALVGPTRRLVDPELRPRRQPGVQCPRRPQLLRRAPGRGRAAGAGTDRQQHATRRSRRALRGPRLDRRLDPGQPLA